MNEAETEIKALEIEQGEQDLPSLEVVYAEVKERLDVQLRQVDSMDSKSGTLLFIASVVIGMGAAVQAALMVTVKEALPLVLFSIPIVFYVVCVLLTMRSWVRRPYFRDPGTPAAEGLLPCRVIPVHQAQAHGPLYFFL
ncbi:hypothetical protein ACFLXC_05590 [Chloroflexota bacterium]